MAVEAATSPGREMRRTLYRWFRAHYTAAPNRVVTPRRLPCRHPRRRVSAPPRPRIQNAAAFDAKSGTGTNVNNSTTVNVTHVNGGSATAIFAVAAYWSTSAAQQDLTGVTYNSVALTKIGASGRSNQQDIVEIYFLAGPATGSNTLAFSFRNSSAGNAGGVQGISFTGTPTSGGSGVVWADFTSTQTASNAANSSISIPNNTSNDGIIDGMAIGNAATPTMGTQTNRTLAASGNANGEGTGASYLVPAPSSGSQTMNWTFGSTSSAQAGVRVLGTSSATKALPLPRRVTRVWFRRF